MTSFLNKKLNLILLILATLLIISTISSASAGRDLLDSTEPGIAQNAIDPALTNYTFDDGNFSKDVILGTNLAVIGSIGTYIGQQPIAVKGNLTVFAINDSSDRVSLATRVNLTTISVDNTIVPGTAIKMSGTVDTTKLDRLQKWYLYFEFISDLNINNTPTDPSTSGYWFIGNFISSNATGGAANPVLGRDYISISLKGTPKITITQVATPKIGQEAAFVVRVTGPNSTNTSQEINLTGVPVAIIDQLGKSIFNGTTNENGTFNFTYLVTALNFYFNATTNINASGLSANYTEANASAPFTAEKGQANLTELWFDSPWGYVIGQPATIFWSFTGIALDTIGNRTITLFYYSNNILQRTEVVNLSSPITINNRTASGHWNTSFTQSHDNLTVIAVFAEDPEYLRSEVRNSTFVDISNESRRTTITASFPQDGLKVGVTSDIKIYVRTFDNKTVNSGSVSVLWDGQWRFDVDVVNGEATFIHTYTQAGAARNVTFTYNGEEAGTRASSVTETVPVLKGTPSIVLTQNPQFVSVGQEVTIAGAINNFALGNNPEYVNLTFKAGEHVWHTINDIAMTFNTNSSAVAQVTYIYTMAHSNLSLVMSFVGNDNYNAASGTITTIVSPAPTI